MTGWGGKSSTQARWKVDAQPLLIFKNSESTKRKMDERDNGKRDQTNRRALGVCSSIQRQKYPEMHFSPN